MIDNFANNAITFIGKELLISHGTCCILYHFWSTIWLGRSQTEDNELCELSKIKLIYGFEFYCTFSFSDVVLYRCKFLSSHVHEA